MTREHLIKRTTENLTKLSDQKLKEVSDFTDFLLRKLDDNVLTEGIQELTSEAKSFQFLNEEEEIYSVEDLKERYK